MNVALLAARPTPPLLSATLPLKVAGTLAAVNALPLAGVVTEARTGAVLSSRKLTAVPVKLLPTASLAVAWTVLPYMPNAQTSTYGGLPGTTVTFYASGFARSEVVHVYVGHTQNSAGSMVGCFRTDEKGNAGASGSYVIPGDAQGKLTFTLTGSQSAGTATATMQVTAAPSPVQVPAQPPFTCPLDTTP